MSNFLSGVHEVALSECGEANMYHNFSNCEKNPGHSNFIRAAEFDIHHLPVEHRDPDVYQLIKAASDLCVRISVKKVSQNRPEYIKHPISGLITNDKYPFHDRRGSKKVRTGSGQIHVLKYTNGQGMDARGREGNRLGKLYKSKYLTCPCPSCHSSGKPSEVWWEILVWTCAHVVYDDDEANSTSCRLFYDNETSPVVLLDNLRLDSVSSITDFCRLKCVTCKEKLGDKLFQMRKQYVALWDVVSEKYKNRPSDRLCFIVSHPHGCEKQISIGQWLENETIGQVNRDYDLTILKYTTCTCPGSSGAIVHCVGFNVDTHMHFGTNKIKQLNFSTTGYYRR